jgi:hypothetical protein
VANAPYCTILITLHSVLVYSGFAHGLVMLYYCLEIACLVANRSCSQVAAVVEMNKTKGEQEQEKAIPPTKIKLAGTCSF